MFEFQYHGQQAKLAWYVQDLVVASLDAIYGQELLTRGSIKGTKTKITTQVLFEYLNKNADLLLAMTCQQLDDLFINQKLKSAIKNSIWINISGKLLTDDAMFTHLWETTLKHISQMDKQKLVLEICEDTIAINDNIVIERIKSLQREGFKIAIDDFGSGHSNLIRLSQVNFDFIKLDLQLIKNVPEDLWATSLYKGIIELCSSKGSLIVAEGVETKAQSDYIRWAGVNIIQGFLYSKPYAMM
tara:strand:+ start:2473 stop:3201 length:729 start_codon:yes stop_codon:yes gene_type:complete